MCQDLYSTGKVVVLDSGFSVLDGIMRLRVKGVFAAAVAKKRRYWPKYVPGDAIEKRMEDAAVGDTDAVNGNLHGKDYHVFCMKEPDYIMKLMSSYSSLLPKEHYPSNRRVFQDPKDPSKTVEASFQYTEPFQNHFLYRHAVDDHNNLRHAVPSIEGTWTTHYWPNRVFSFLLAVTEVNAFLATKYFLWDQGGSSSSKKNVKKDGEEQASSKQKRVTTLHEFRRKLALSLIYNEFLPNQEVVRRKRKYAGCYGTDACNHTLCTAPNHASDFIAGKWLKHSKSPYQQFVCKKPGCSKRIRTYCSCSPAFWLCSQCFSEHRVHETLAEERSD